MIMSRPAALSALESLGNGEHVVTEPMKWLVENGL